MHKCIYALQRSVAVTDPVFTKTQPSWAAFQELLHRISLDFDRGVVADTRSKQTDGWTWSPRKDFFSFLHKKCPKPIPVRNVRVSISSNVRISWVSVLSHHPQVLYYPSRSAPITIFYLFVQITVYLGPTAGCPQWPYQPAMQLADDLMWK